MTTKSTRKTSMTNYRPPQMDEDQFHALFDILHDGCFEGNWTATSRALQISINTCKRWSREAPKRYWEFHNLHKTVREVHAYMAASKHKKTRKRAEKVLGQLHRAGLQTIAETIQANTHSDSEALIHLVSTIAWTPHREISTEELHLPANSGGFSKRTLRLAAEQIGLTKETKGYGPDKITWYSIPEP